MTAIFVTQAVRTGQRKNYHYCCCARQCWSPLDREEGAQNAKHNEEFQDIWSSSEKYIARVDRNVKCTYTVCDWSRKTEWRFEKLERTTNGRARKRMRDGDDDDECEKQEKEGSERRQPTVKEKVVRNGHTSTNVSQ